jgi:hypothetical protein
VRTWNFTMFSFISVFFWALINFGLAHCCSQVFRCKYSSDDTVARFRDLPDGILTETILMWICRRYHNAARGLNLLAVLGFSLCLSVSGCNGRIKNMFSCPAEMTTERRSKLVLDSSGTVTVENRASSFWNRPWPESGVLYCNLYTFFAQRA